VPYTRIFAAFMLATLISTLFTLPAQAALPTDVGVAITSAPASGSNVKVGSNVVYTITVTNYDATNPTLAADVVVTDNIGTGTWVSDDAACVNTTPVFTCTDPAAIAASGTWVIHITVTGSTLGALTNGASVSETGDGNAANDTAGPSTTTVVAALADLTITKNHTGTLTPGSDVTYNLVVTNAGPDAAAGVVVTDTLAAGLTFKSSSTGCTAALQVVTCNIASVAMGTPQTMTFIATIGAAVAAGTVIANTASVTTTTAESDGTNNGSNTDSITVGAASVDLGVAISVLPTTAGPGDVVTYSVTVSNLSTTTDATGIVATDALPAGLITAQPPTAPTVGTTNVAGNTWTWNIPTLTKAVAPATSNTVTATFDATVDPTVDATTTPTITNTVTVAGAQTDPVSTNNTASADLTISAEQADLNLTTTVNDSKPNQGDTIHISIMVSNAGPADATNVDVKDVLPTGLKYVSCSHCTSGLRRQTSKPITFASIPNGQAGLVVLNVLVQASSGTVQNVASIVSSDQADPTPANDADTQVITIGGAANNPGGGGTGGTGGTGGGTGGTTGGTTAFTGFTAGQLMPWFMLLFSLGLVAVEWSRRMRLVSPIGSTYGFEPPF